MGLPHRLTAFISNSLLIQWPSIQWRSIAHLSLFIVAPYSVIPPLFEPIPPILPSHRFLHTVLAVFSPVRPSEPVFPTRRSFFFELLSLDC